MKLLFPRKAQKSELTKVCPICEKRKRMEAFPVTNKAKGYLHSYCKPCLSLYGKHRYQTIKSKS